MSCKAEVNGIGRRRVLPHLDDFTLSGSSYAADSGMWMYAENYAFVHRLPLKRLVGGEGGHVRHVEQPGDPQTHTRSKIIGHDAETEQDAFEQVHPPDVRWRLCQWIEDAWRPRPEQRSTKGRTMRE